MTGGASGLSEATVTCFAKHGAYVTIADVSILTKDNKLAQEAGQDSELWESSAAAFKHVA